MGQAAVDLPDPMQPTPPAAPLTSADDLLSQMAGDEIDRMLAESDIERDAQPLVTPPPAPSANAVKPIARAITPPSPSSKAPPEPAADDATTEDATTAAQLDDLLNQITASSLAPSPSAHDSPVKTVSPALDDDLAASTAVPTNTAEPAVTAAPAASAESSVEPVAPPAEAAAPAEAVAPALLPPLVPGQPTEAGTSSAERVALDASAALNEVCAAAAPIPAQHSVAEDAADLPLLLKPLEWLSAPLMLFPETVREALGKIALLTLFNAVAVLIYVLLFRRHMH